VKEVTLETTDKPEVKETENSKLQEVTAKLKA
jgi:hypothetical protein